MQMSWCQIAHQEESWWLDCDCGVTWFISYYKYIALNSLNILHSREVGNILFSMLLLGMPSHDDVSKWKQIPRYWPFVRGIHRSPVNSPHKGQWRGALMFSLICARINGWANNREAGDLWCYRAHYDVTVIPLCELCCGADHFAWIAMLINLFWSNVWHAHICGEVAIKWWKFLLRSQGNASQHVTSYALLWRIAHG